MESHTALQRHPDTLLADLGTLFKLKVKLKKCYGISGQSHPLSYVPSMYMFSSMDSEGGMGATSHPNLQQSWKPQGIPSTLAPARGPITLATMQDRQPPSPGTPLQRTARSPGHNCQEIIIIKYKTPPQFIHSLRWGWEPTGIPSRYAHPPPGRPRILVWDGISRAERSCVSRFWEDRESWLGQLLLRGRGG